MVNNLKSLNLFVDRLIEEKGLTYLEPKILEQVRSDLKERLEDIINAKIIELLPPEKLEEFDKLLYSNVSDEIVRQFCRDNIPDSEEALARLFLDFRETYLGKVR